MTLETTTPVSVILPVFNERDNLEEMQARLGEVLKSMGREYEIVYVDDGSTDGSWDVLKKLAEQHAGVRVIRLRKNFGQTPALAAGFAYSRHPIVVTLDADLQNDPADIPRLLAKLADCDVVSGWRRHRKDVWLTRLVPSYMANFLIRKVSGVFLHDFGCTLKAYRRDIVRDVNLYGEMHRFLPVLAAWVGGRVTELEVVHHPRTRGTSKYGLLRTYKVFVDLITIKFISDFQSRPNYVFAGFGVLNLLLGCLALIVVAYRVFALRRLEATPMVFFMLMFFLTGVFSLFFGFLAEIVIRGFYDTQRKPTYYVRETVGLDSTG
jgi:glycosyltransferase involved in cell wall biosynthesis